MHFSYLHSLVPDEEFRVKLKSIVPYMTRLSAILEKGEYGERESSVCLPSDQALLDAVSVVYRKKIKIPLRYVVVVGIGGSNLGVKAVYDALVGHGDALRDDNRPRMIFLDANDEEITRISVAHLTKNIRDPDELIITVISESGKTTETIANAEYLIHELKIHFPGIERRVVVITQDGSPLSEIAHARGIAVLSVPESVAGRYSVFSAAGLFPLMAAGIDTAAFRGGALDMRTRCLLPDITENPAFRGAVFLSYWYARGLSMNNVFLFNPELESLGKWYRQLLAESIGKSEKIGITPIISIGSIDLHSVGQLYLGGPKDKTTLFVSSIPSNDDVRVPHDLIFPDLIPAAKGKSFGEITKAMQEGVEIAYKNYKLPFVGVIFEKIGERELGAFMEWKMIETMYLGQFLGVNAFDQPEVEVYKKETERILKNT